MRSIVLMCVLLSGCVAPPISITQSGLNANTDRDSRNRWIVVIYDRQSSVTGALPSSPNDTESSGVVLVGAADATCPQYKPPFVGRVPTIGDIDKDREGDYEYIAGVVLDHVEAMMKYTSDLKRRQAEAYDVYINACALSVD